MIKVLTQNPIAVDSDDHIHPEGIYLDNNLNPEFINSVESYFQRKINFLDLGCAGGRLVCNMHERGHKSIGLEGSDHCLNIIEDMVNEVGCLPYGHEEWKKYGNEILFTCDITKDYDILEDDNILQFDLITCWDVMEHFNPDDVNNFMFNLKKHLKIGGIFVASIALFPSYRHETSLNTPENLNYHKSLFPKEWWIGKLDSYLYQIEYPFSCCNRSYIPIYGEPNRYLVYAGKRTI